jgi:hypothetical protein
MRTEQEIRADIEAVQERCKGWLSCTDGSYEACCADNGYLDLWKELRKTLEENNGKTNATVGGNQCQDSQG